MSLRIQTNVDALRAYRHLGVTTDQLGKSNERLSSGYRLNSAADDAAGLSISKRLEAQVSGLDMAQQNIGNAVAMVQTAEGALDQVHSILQRVRDLAVEYNNSTLAAGDRFAITTEVIALSTEVARIAGEAKFNGIALLTGATTTLTFQVGADNTSVITFQTDALVGATYVPLATFNFGATTASITQVDASIEGVSKKRGSLGSIQNRLDYTSANNSIYSENLSDSLSSIRDTDMAAEMVNFTKLQVLQQAGVAMLGQANLLPQSVLSLLR